MTPLLLSYVKSTVHDVTFLDSAYLAPDLTRREQSSIQAVFRQSHPFRLENLSFWAIHLSF